MIKVCSLDFLNNKVFEKDILSLDGKVLFKADDRVTPESLLKLYFRNIYVQNPITASKAEAQSRIPISNMTLVSVRDNVFDADLERVAVMEENNAKSDASSLIPQSASSSQEDYFYTKIVEYATSFGKKLNLSEGEIKKLEDLAYYYVLKEMDESIPDEMKEDVQFCHRSYRANEFPLIGNISYVDIIFIIAYYVKMLKVTQSKQKTIYKMLWYGNNKFNPFFLHKFLNMMKDD